MSVLSTTLYCEPQTALRLCPKEGHEESEPGACMGLEKRATALCFQYLHLPFSPNFIYSTHINQFMYSMAKWMQPPAQLTGERERVPRQKEEDV